MSSDNLPSDWDRRRKYVYERDDYRCQNCGRYGGPNGNLQLECHHIVPKARGGAHHTSNLITLCSACHTAVHNKRSVAPTAGQRDAGQPTGQASILYRVLRFIRWLT